MHKTINEIVFDSLDDFHNYITSDNSLIRDAHLPLRLGRLSEKLEDQEAKEYCMYELHIFSFSFDKGNLKIKSKNTDGTEYPSFNLFTDDLVYLKERANEEENSKYKLHYNHLLWKSPAKHGNYAKTAIDHYILFLSNSPISAEDNLANQAYSHYYKNLFSLSQEINYRKDDVLSILTENLASDKINGYQKCSMIKHIVENGKQIDLPFYQSLFNYSNEVIDNNVYPDFLPDYLYLQILICQKRLKSQPSVFYEKLGDYHLEEASRHPDSFVVHDFYLKAIVQYKKAGNKTKVEEVSVLLQNAKKQINLPKVDLGNDEALNGVYQIWIEMYDKMTDKLMEQPYEIIYTDLIARDIFPKADQLGKSISTSLADVFSTMSFDLNGNISKKKKGLGISPYHLHVQNFSWEILWMVFRKGIRCGKVSYQTLVEYLQNHSWYYDHPEGSSEDGIVENFNWMQLILPSLKSFFDQIQFDLEQKNTTPEGYILAVDSLALKFEGIIREISRRIGAQTIEFQEDETQERISFDKLLDNPKLQELIPADDIAFFKYLFTSQGMNLRNNVAHCFYPSNKYGPALMIMMITALLRLGNYEFVSSEE